MSDWYEAIRFSQLDAKQDHSLQAFTQLLRAAALPHRVAEEQGELVLWVDSLESVEHCQNLYQRFQSGELEDVIRQVDEVVKQQPRSQWRWQQLLNWPVTLIFSIGCLLGFAIVHFAQWQIVSLLSFQGLHLQDNVWLINDKLQAWELLKQGQVWRLFTPMFLHFGLIHIAFNSVLFVFFAKQIETKEGGLFLFSHVMLLALLSNLGQFWFSNGQLFGGMSGVVYGLMGYCWLLNILRKTNFYNVPQGLMVVSVVMIGLSLIGVFSLFGMSIANWAHILGLLAGLGLALVRK